MRSGVAFARLPVTSSHLIEPLHYTIPSTTTLSFKHSFRLSLQPRPFPTLANCLFTTRYDKRSPCRSLLIRVVLVCWNLRMFIQCRLTDNVYKPIRFPPVPSCLDVSHLATLASRL